MEEFEQAVVVVVSWAHLGIEMLGALVLVIGIVATLIHALRDRRSGADRHGFRHLRLVLSQYLAMALEFQLAADILATTIAPSWAEIGRLAAVAAIRTGLNYFLEREMRSMEEQGESPPRRPWPGAESGSRTSENES